MNQFSKVKVRYYSKANFARFRDILMTTDWLQMVEAEDNLDESASVLLCTLKSLFNFSFPERTIRVRKSDPEWMSCKLRFLINDRDQSQ